MIKRAFSWCAAAVLLAAVPAPASAADLWVTYAPVIHLTKGESKRPANAGEFLQNSSLRWSHGGCPDHEIAARGSVNAKTLGSGGYAHNSTGRLCSHSGKKYSSNQNVRPHGSLGAKEGMFLDLNNDKRGIGSVQAEVYFDYGKGSHLTYWLFYAYNDGPSVQNHEGDWERISIRLDAANKPLTVAYFHHGKYCVQSYASAAKVGTHPVGYSASGTHATYPKAGTFPTEFPGVNDNANGGGEVWETQKRSVLNVKSQPWYGFGGAWGEIGESTHTTGPSGPSAFKGPTPANWSSPAC